MVDQYLKVLNQDLKFYKDNIKEVAQDIIKDEFSKFPVFVASVFHNELGELILDGQEMGRTFSIMASTLEQMTEKNIKDTTLEELDFNRRLIGSILKPIRLHGFLSTKETLTLGDVSQFINEQLEITTWDNDSLVDIKGVSHAIIGSLEKLLDENGIDKNAFVQGEVKHTEQSAAQNTWADRASEGGDIASRKGTHKLGE